MAPRNPPENKFQVDFVYKRAQDSPQMTSPVTPASSCLHIATDFWICIYPQWPLGPKIGPILGNMHVPGGSELKKQVADLQGHYKARP